MPPVRLVRFAKLTVLIADVSTIFCAFLIVGWQIIIFLRDGSWWVLPLSLVFSRHDQGEIYSTASIDKIVASQSNLHQCLPSAADHHGPVFGCGDPHGFLFVDFASRKRAHENANPISLTAPYPKRHIQAAVAPKPRAITAPGQIC